MSALTAEERRSLAQQITTNPLFEEVVAGIETDALEALVSADTEQARVEAQWRVRAARSFRSDLESALGTRERKAAPA